MEVMIAVSPGVSGYTGPDPSHHPPPSATRWRAELIGHGLPGRRRGRWSGRRSSHCHATGVFFGRATPGITRSATSANGAARGQNTGRTGSINMGRIGGILPLGHCQRAHLLSNIPPLAQRFPPPSHGIATRRGRAGRPRSQDQGPAGRPRSQEYRPMSVSVPTPIQRTNFCSSDAGSVPSVRKVPSGLNAVAAKLPELLWYLLKVICPVAP